MHCHASRVWGGWARERVSGHAGLAWCFGIAMHCLMQAMCGAGCGGCTWLPWMHWGLAFLLACQLVHVA